MEIHAILGMVRSPSSEGRGTVPAAFRPSKKPQWPLGRLGNIPRPGQVSSIQMWAKVPDLLATYMPVAIEPQCDGIDTQLAAECASAEAAASGRQSTLDSVPAGAVGQLRRVQFLDQTAECQHIIELLRRGPLGPDRAAWRPAMTVGHRGCPSRSNGVAPALRPVPADRPGAGSGQAAPRRRSARLNSRSPSWGRGRPAEVSRHKSTDGLSGYVRRVETCSRTARGGFL